MDMEFKVYTWTKRTWRERLFTLPWQPRVKLKRVRDHETEAAVKRAAERFRERVRASRSEAEANETVYASRPLPGPLTALSDRAKQVYDTPSAITEAKLEALSRDKLRNDQRRRWYDSAANTTADEPIKLVDVPTLWPAPGEEVNVPPKLLAGGGGDFGGGGASGAWGTPDTAPCSSEPSHSYTSSSSDYSSSSSSSDSSSYSSSDSGSCSSSSSDF